MNAAPDFNLPWEACGNLIRDKLTAGGGGFLMAEVPASLGNSCARAEFIVRACNSYDALLEYFRAGQDFANTTGHPDATVAQEREAEDRFDRASDAVRALLRAELLASAEVNHG